MTRGSPPTAVLLTAGLMLAGPGPTLVRAADDPVGQPQAAVESREEAMVVGRLRLHGVGAGRQRPEYDLGRVFDQQVFGRAGGPGGQAVVIRNGVVMPVIDRPQAGIEAGLAAVRQRAEGRIGILEQVCRLDESQVTRLRLALQSDLKRLAYEIASVRAMYAEKTTSAAGEGLDHELLARLRSDADACRRRIDQLPDSGSLVFASLPHVLEPAQVAAFAEWLADQRGRRWQAMVESTLAELDGAGLRLAKRQHAALRGILLGEVPPLNVLREGPAGKANPIRNRLQMALVLARLAAREPGWQPVLDPRQQEFLRQRIGQVGGGNPAAVEQLLVQQGMLEEVDP